jgi:hypothetical protein
MRHTIMVFRFFFATDTVYGFLDVNGIQYSFRERKRLGFIFDDVALSCYAILLISKNQQTCTAVSVTNFDKDIYV